MNTAPDNTEHAGIVEPYELPVVHLPQPDDDDDAAAAAATTPTTTVSEVDLSGYHYDLVPTYKMIDDCDDQDTLFRIQFLQAFGITNDEYHPDIVSAVMDELYDRFRDNPEIRAILESHPMFHPGTTPASASAADPDPDHDTTTPPDSPSPIGHHITPEGDNSEMIFCMMFSFQLFDLFHKCLRHAKHGEEIPTLLRDEIAECFRRMF
jgi:hypothetical protein